ncbi:MAG: hypothetical protein ACFBSE_25440, partial [Prochloraceae cyanobacterium]
MNKLLILLTLSSLIGVAASRELAAATMLDDSEVKEDLKLDIVSLEAQDREFKIAIGDGDGDDDEDGEAHLDSNKKKYI